MDTTSSYNWIPGAAGGWSHPYSTRHIQPHEAEKQYRYSYYPNRFKNKNEAERHQNSLHLRRNSWSCSAITSFQGAFHDSQTRPGEADTCSYCGLDFPRTGEFVGQGSKRTTHEDWEAWPSTCRMCINSGTGQHSRAPPRPSAPSR
jgi:hypothetical protein